MRNIRITVQYEGTRYKGWQRQVSTEQTIQGKLESVLSRQFERKIEIDGSGRTDGGVHARGQVANFRLKEEETELFHQNMEELTALLNGYLPEDIAVLGAELASDRFHSRLNAVSKTYKYRIWNSPVPNVFDRKYVWQVKEPLDVQAMERAAGYLLGEHDFAAFCGNPRMKKSTVRKIHEIRIEERSGNRPDLYGQRFFTEYGKDHKRHAGGNRAERTASGRDRRNTGIKGPEESRSKSSCSGPDPVGSEVRLMKEKWVVAAKSAGF